MFYNLYQCTFSFLNLISPLTSNQQIITFQLAAGVIFQKFVCGLRQKNGPVFRRA